MRELLFTSLLATIALAQIPDDTLVSKRFARISQEAQYLLDHPGAVTERRLENTVHFKNPDGTHTAIFSRGLSHVEPATNDIVPTALEVWQTDAGYRTVAGPVVVRIIDGQAGSSDLELYNLATGKAVKLNSNRVTYNGDDTLSFDFRGLAWTITLLPEGLDLKSSSISTRLGAQTYTFPYISGLVSLTPDASTGDLVGDDNFRLTRPAMIGADGSRTECSAWSLGSKSMSSVCDDSTLPALAFPYYIDPTAEFAPPVAADDGSVQLAGAGWPPTPGSYSIDTTTDGQAVKDIWNGSYQRKETLFRWDTSSIPDTATIVSARFDGSWRSDQPFYPGTGACTTKIEWVSPSIWPIDSADYTNSPGNSAYQGDPRNIVTTTTTGDLNVWTLTNANSTNISLTGYTAVRVALVRGSAPPSNNTECFAVLWMSEGPIALRPTLQVTYDYPPSTISATPNSGTLNAGTWYTFTAVYRDPDGYADIASVRLLPAYGVDGTQCYVGWRRDTNQICVGQGGDPFSGTCGTAGSGAVLTYTNYCSLDPANSSVTNSGTDTTVNYRLLFSSAYSGGGWTKHTYTHVFDAAGAAGGWTDYGTWALIPSGPKLIVVTQ